MSIVEEKPFELSDVDFEVKPGSLTMVVGPVGSGKSTLVSALNKFITCSSGDVKVSGTVSYCAQQAWILNATVKDNILFGQESRRSEIQEDGAISPTRSGFGYSPGRRSNHHR